MANARPRVTRMRERKGTGALLPTLLLPFAGSSLHARPQNTAALMVRVLDARNTKGKIGVTLFQEAQGFSDHTSKAIRQQSVDIDPNTLSAQTTFKDPPRGTSAVSVLYDENGNGKMGKNFIGIPNEGYGTSNNPNKKNRAPSFDGAKLL
jgi:uncharacterized protein (DUF2141 family)